MAGGFFVGKNWWASSCDGWGNEFELRTKDRVIRVCLELPQRPLIISGKAIVALADKAAKAAKRREKRSS